MQDTLFLLQQHRAFQKSGKALDVSYRLAALKRLRHSIEAHEAEITAALRADLNKSPFEAYATEIGMVLEELSTVTRHLPGWARSKHVKTPLMHFLSSSRLYPEPYGTVLIMAPWNYPFQLNLIPLIGAVAAGNCCVVKPSEYAPHTADILETIIGEVFEAGHVSVVRGGREANQDLLQQQFDYIFFTGSPAVGHAVMEAAARYLTPMTLELGGKSPCIVEKSADIPLAARRIVWGKLLNAGQTCIAPDYILVDESCKQQLVEEMEKTVRRFYGEHPEQADSYPKIINQKHFDRLQNLLSSGTILFGGQINRETRQIAPTVMEPDSLDSPVMQEEIFGPIFPVLTFTRMEQVYDLVSSRPKPLALYLFTKNKAVMEQTSRRLSFGGGCINDTITHIANPYLPFGGVGNSGMGQYHGRRTFEVFTHQKSVLTKSNLVDVPLRYPTHQKYLPLLKKLMK